MPYEQSAPDANQAPTEFDVALAKLAEELAKGGADAGTRRAAPAVNRPRVPIFGMEGLNGQPSYAPEGTTPEWTTPFDLGGTALIPANERNALAGPRPAHGAVRSPPI